MYIDEFSQEVERLLALLEKTNDEAKIYELQGLIANLNIAKSVGILDPLTDINSVTVLDMNRLKEAIDGAQNAIEDEKTRASFVERAMALIREAMSASGV